jgi:hypothetical protein
MRSVCFHLIDVARHEVAGYLSAIADPNGDDGDEGWCLPRGSRSPTLFIDFYEDLEAEAETGELAILKAALGRMPDVVVMMTVSGRIPGDAEVVSFADLLMRKFRGVAWDDYTTHCWTLEEIKSRAKAYGHPFFDYAGWRRKEHSDPAA